VAAVVGGITYGDANKDGTVDADETAELDVDATGLWVEDFDFGYVSFTSSLIDLVKDALEAGGVELDPFPVPNKWYALAATAAAAELIGIDAITAELQDIEVFLNAGESWNLGGLELGPSILDFAASFATDEQQLLFDVLSAADGGVPDGEVSQADLNAAFGVGVFTGTAVTTAELVALLDADGDGVLTTSEVVPNLDATFKTTDLTQDVDDPDNPGSTIPKTQSNLEWILEADADNDDKYDPPGYEVNTGGAPVYIDYDGNERIGGVIGHAELRISEFVHVSGSLAFEKGPGETVSVATGFPNQIGEDSFLADALKLLTDAFDLLPGDLSIDPTLQTISGVDVGTMQFGGANLTAFVGMDGPYTPWMDLDDDGNESWAFNTGSDADDATRTVTAGTVYAVDPADGQLKWYGATPLSPPLGAVDALTSILPQNAVAYWLSAGDPMTDVAAVVGGLSYGDINQDGIVDAGETGELNGEATGLWIDDFDFGFAMFSSSVIDLIKDALNTVGVAVNPFPVPSKWYAMAATADAAELVGIDAITAALHEIEIVLNAGESWNLGPLQFGPSVIDFQTSFATDEQQLLLNVLSGGDGDITQADLDTAFGDDVVIGTAVTTAELVALLDANGDEILTTSEVVPLLLQTFKDAPADPGDPTGDTNLDAILAADADGDDKYDPAGYEVMTGGAPVYINYDANFRIGGSIGHAQLAIDQFVHITGSLAFEMGPGETVSVDTGLPALGFIEPLLEDLLNPLASQFGLNFPDGVQTIEGLAVDSLQFGAADLHAFVGLGGPYWTDLDADGSVSWSFDSGDGDDTSRTVTTGTVYAVDPADGQLKWYGADPGSPPLGAVDALTNILPDNTVAYWLTGGGFAVVGGMEYGDGANGGDIDGKVDAVETDELDDDAAGLWIQDFDFGFSMLTPSINSIPGVGQILPTFYALKATADSAGLIGFDEDVLKATVSDIEVNVNGGLWGSAVQSALFSALGPAALIFTPAVKYDTSFATDELDLLFKVLSGGDTVITTAELNAALTDGYAGPDIVSIGAMVDWFDTDNDEILTTSEVIPLLSQTFKDAMVTDPSGQTPDVKSNLEWIQKADADGDDKYDPPGYEIGTGAAPVYLSGPEYDDPAIRAVAGAVEFDVAGVVQLYGSVAFVLGPSTEVTLSDGAKINVQTMSIGGTDIFGFVGVGPHWVDSNGDGKITDADTPANGAIGLAIEDVSFGIAVMANLDLTNPGVFLSLDIEVPTVELVGIPGLELAGALALGVNVGASLGSLLAVVDHTASFPDELQALFEELGGTAGPDGTISASDFDAAFDNDALLAAGIALPAGPLTKDEFFALLDVKDTEGAALPAGDGILSTLEVIPLLDAGFAGFDDVLLIDEDGDDKYDLGGFEVETGAAPIYFSGSQYEDFLISVQVAGTMTFKIDDDPIFAVLGVLHLEVSDTGLDALALGALRIGSDIDTDADALLDISVLGVLILNEDGIAGDLDVDFALDVPGIELGVSARVIFNSTGVDQDVVVPDLLFDFLEDSANPLAQDLINRLDANQAYVVNAGAPKLVDSMNEPDLTNVDNLLKGVPGGVVYEPAGPYFLAALSGNFDFVGLASASGVAAVSVKDTGFELLANLEFGIGPLDFEVTGLLGIYSDGLLVDLSVDLDVNLLSLFEIDASGDLHIDTRTSTSGSPIFDIDLDGTIAILSVFKLDGHFDMSVSAYEWDATISASVDLFVLSLGATGSFNSEGDFHLGLTGDIDWTIADSGIEGSFSADVWFDEDGDTWGTELGGSNDFRFYVDTSIGAVFLGIDMLTAAVSVDATGDLDGSVSIDMNVAGSGEVLTLIIDVVQMLASAAEAAGLAVINFLGDLGCEIESWFGDCEEWVEVEQSHWEEVLDDAISFDLHLGTINLPGALVNPTTTPPPLKLAGELDGSAWDGTGDGTLYLNVGNRAMYRDASLGTSDVSETYSITQSGSTVTIYGFGKTETYEGVTSIVGDFGAQNDTVIVAAGVLVGATISGGIGNDTLSYFGSGIANLSGNDGDDTLTVGGLAFASSILQGGGDQDTLINSTAADIALHGGGGNDLLKGGSGNDSTLHGDDGNDTIVGGAGLDQASGGLGNDTFREYLTDLVAGEGFDGGTGFDTVEIIGTSSADDLRVMSGALASQVRISSYVGGLESGWVVAEDLERIDLNGGDGSDDFSIDGSQGLSGVTSVAIDLGADGGDPDEVFLTLQETADKVVLGTAGAQQLSALWTPDGDPTVFFNLVNALSPDQLTIKALGGDDSINGASVQTSPFQWITMEGGDDNDTLIGTFGVDHLDGGLGDDRMSGLGGTDLFLDAGGNDLLDELDLTLSGSAAFGIYGNKFVTGTASLDGSGEQHTLAGFAAGATVEDIGGASGDGIFETVRLIGGGGANLFFAGAAGGSIMVGGSLVNVTDLSGTIDFHGLDGDDQYIIELDGLSTTGATDVRVVEEDDIIHEAELLQLDTNGDGLLQVTEAAGALDPLADTGSDGVLSLTDLINFYDKNGDGTAGTNNNSKLDVTDDSDLLALASLDVDGDGVLSLSKIVFLAGGNDLVVVRGTSGADDGTASESVVNMINNDGVTMQVPGALGTDYAFGSNHVQSYDEIEATEVYLLGGADVFEFIDVNVVNLLDTGADADIVRIRDVNAVTEVRGGAGADRFDVQRINAATTIKGDADSDTFNIGSNAIASVGPDHLNDGLLDQIGALLTLDGGTGAADIANLDDTADLDDESATLTGTTLAGLGMAGSIGYANLDSLRIHTGEGDEQFTVAGTHAGDTTINTNDGDDKVAVRATTGTTWLNTGAGSDTIHVGSTTSPADSGGGGSIVDLILGLLVIDGGADFDVINVDDSGNTADKAGTLTATTLRGLEMPAGIDYFDAEDFNLWLGTGNDGLFIVSTHVGTTQVWAGSGNATTNENDDTIAIESIDGATTIHGEGGNDAIHVNVTSPDVGTSGFHDAFKAAVDDTADPALFDALFERTHMNGLAAVLNLHGEGGSDEYTLNLAGEGTALVNVHDNGAPNDGADILVINGADDVGFLGNQPDDTFLLRRDLVVLLNESVAGSGFDQMERVNYDENINARLIVNGLGGDDTIVADDNSSITTLDGGDGDDLIQIGQVFGTPRDDAAGLAPEDQFNTTAVIIGVITDPVTGVVIFDPSTFNPVTDPLPPATLSAIYKAIGDQAAKGESLDGIAYVSNGVSYATTVYGGDGEDTFNVYHNKGTLRLEGEAGDDAFVVRAFVTLPADPDDPMAEPVAAQGQTDLKGGAGADTIQYAINAPVNIDGGAGIDTVLVLGTPFGDSFVVTSDGIFGAGLNVTFTNVESASLDALEGDDSIYILGTQAGLVTSVVGGLGSDTIDIMGDVLTTIVSNDLSGASSQVDHDTSSTDPDYDQLGVNGVAVNVLSADAGSLVNIDTSAGPLVVTENGTTASYFISLVDPALATAPVYLTVSAGVASSEDKSNGGASVLVSVNGGPFTNAVVLTFDGATAGSVFEIQVMAVDDAGAEGPRAALISHSIISADPKFSGIALIDTFVNVVDNDLAGLDIRHLALQSDGTYLADGSTEVLEGLGGFGDVYSVALTGAPEIGETVTIALGTNGQITALSGSGDAFLTFTSANWMTAQNVFVSAVDDADLEGLELSTLLHQISSDGLVYGSGLSDVALDVSVFDDEAPSVIVRETGGSTVVTKDGTDVDSYWIRLTSQPTDDVTLTLTTDTQTFLSSSSIVSMNETGTGGVFTYDVVFTDSTWSEWIEIEVRGNPDAVTPDGTTLIFASQDQNLDQISGPLIVEGGVGQGDVQALLPPIMLVGETDDPSGQVFTPTAEADDIDVLTVFHADNAGPESGVLSYRMLDGAGNPLANPGLSLTGFGMGGDLVLATSTGGPEVTYGGGITLNGFEVFEVLLGSGDETLTIHDTGDRDEKDPTVTDDPASITLIHGGGGDDTIIVTDRGEGALVIYGDTSEDGARYGLGSEDGGEPAGGTATSFNNPGNDTIDASQMADQGDAFVGLVAYGGPGNDIITGSQGDDQLAGGDGGDTIDGQAGVDHVYGDSHFNIDANLFAQDQIERFDATDPDELALIDAMFTVVSAGAGANDSLVGDAGDDILFGDHGVIDQVAGTRRIESTGEVIALRTVSMTEGGNDTITGDAGVDRIFGGALDDLIDAGTGNDIVFGDGGEVIQPNGVPVTIRSTDTSIGGDDTITGFTGADMILGGTGADLIRGDDELPDTEEALGGGSSLGSSSDGSDTLTGGAGVDSAAGDPLDAGASDADIILGDSGEILLVAGVATEIRTTSPAIGGSDTIEGNLGGDTILGGAAGDDISGNDGADLILGDNGEVLQPGGVPATIQSTDTSIGGADTIAGNAGADMILGGADADTISGDDEPDIILGDSGQILLVGGAATEIRTTSPTIGGSDTISGDLGDDTILGGAAGDDIAGDAGTDVILGDNGEVLITSLLIHTTDPTVGGADTISAGSGDDIVLGGTSTDTIFGDSGNDLLLGDHGEIDLSQPQPVNFTSIFTGAADGGDDDVIHGNDAADTALGAGETDEDTILGQQGDDQLFGGLGDDDLIGGHNVAGGIDELGAVGSGNDTMDGGAGDDVLAGDNAIVIRRADALSPLMKVLVGETLYDMNLLPDVTGAVQLNPLGVIGRDITLLDHDSAAAFFGGGGQFFGDDSIAGGAHDDLVFGQLGDDVIQGDGSTTNDVLADGFSTVGADDGDDYIEGNGGDDLIFGNLGQDDIIGGSSSLFGLTLQSQRIDGADVLFGGAGTDIAYGTFGDLSAEGHALDADVLIGDNANVFRIVGVNGVDSGAFLSFNYDDYSAVESIVVRAYDLLDDYEEAGDVAGGVLANPVESGLGGADVIHGEAGDDTIAGMLGADVMFGEGQDDNVIGGEGTDWMSGGTGQDGMLGDGGHVFTSRNGVAEPLFGIAATSEQFISLPGNQGSTTLNVNGKLSKSVDLEPFDIGDDDTLYGGLGDDSLHGGAGIDGLSGAEALPGFYADPASTPVIVYDASELVNDFVDFDDFDPAQKILGFGLNFAAFEGDPGNPIDDGDDVLFGDLGNDWLVGGTGSDHLYGGYGNDILNLDDNLDTDGGENTSEDTGPYAGPDTALGGAGRDTLLGNSKSDRMFDWVGEFNAYVVPFNPFGKAAISRNLSPAIEQFFYDISESDGADQTRVGPGLGTEARNGEPFGELGLVTQEDDDWQAQTGAPDDPQQGGGGTEDPGSDPMPYTIVGGVYVVEFLDPPNSGVPPIIDVGGGLVTGVRGDAGVGGETGLGGMESATTSESDSSARIEGLEIFGTADDTDTDVIVVDAADTETDATSTRDFGLDDLTISLATTGELEDTSTETEVVVTTTETEERSEWTIEEADETPLVRTDSDPLLVWRRESVTDREVMTVDPLSL